MLIGIDASRAVGGQRTGTEAYAWFLLRALIPLAGGEGHTIHLYFNAAPPPDLFPSGEHVEEVVIPFARLWTHVRLAAELQQRPPDVFFTPAHVIPLSYHGRSAATVHDLGYHYFPEAHPQRQLAYLKWSTRHNGRRANRVFADSQTTMDDLVRFDGIPAEKIEVVYPGIDPDLQRTDGDAITAVCQKYHITPPYFLYISTLHPRKNLERLVQAFAQSNLSHRLVLAGKKGWLSQPILDTIANLQSPISAKIMLPGYIADEDKAALISGATAVLYPSLYEGFGFPILEAQVCGVPVLTANSSSCPEVAGDAALLVDPSDINAITEGMIQLAQDDTVRQTLVTRGHANIPRFSWEKTAQQVLQALEVVGRE